MKLLRLDLRAFGPFTGESLDFSPDTAALQIVYGPNEAGKSSALRALRQHLFGIDTRTSDAFLHPMTSLRIGALLSDADGTLLECVRRKGNKNTLSDASDEKPLDEALLDRLHGGLDAAKFQSMFGIDHGELVRGGQAILQGKGSLGETLFSAATGLSDLRAITLEFEQQADSIYAPRGKRPLNQAIGRYEEARKRVKSLALPPREWQEQDQLLQTARSGLAEVEGRLTDVSREHARLTRFGQILPLVAQYVEQVKHLYELGQPPRLSAQFGRDRMQATTDLSVANERLTRARERLQALQQQLDAQQVPAWLTGDDAWFTQLEVDLGEYRTAQKHRPGLVSGRDRLRTEAAALFRELRPEGDPATMEQWRISRPEQVRIRQLGTAHAKLSERLALVQSNDQQQQTRLAAAEARLQQLPPAADATGLRAALRRVQGQGRLEYELTNAEQDEMSLQQQAAIELKQLGLWRGTLAELETLAVPAAELIEQFDTALAAIESQLAQLAAQAEKNLAERARIAQQLEALQLEGAVPSEAELLAARERRDRLWDELKGAISQDQAEQVTNLTTRFEASMRDADELVDRLRREAGRVANRAALDASHRANIQDSELLASRHVQATQQRDELLARWHELWKPLDISPQPPRAMRAWRGQQQVVSARAGDLRRQRTIVQHCERQVAAARADLLQSLPRDAEPGDWDTAPLALLLQHAEQWVEAQDQASRSRAALGKQCDDLRAERDANQSATSTARSAWEEWSQTWRQAMAPLGLPTDASPEQANVVLELTSQIFEKLKEAQSLADRVAEIDRYSQGFEQQAREAATRLIPEIASSGAVEIAERLLADHKQATRHLAKLEALQKQQAECQTEIESVESAARQARARLSALCQEAGCDDARELPDIERRAAAAVQATTALQQTTTQLLNLGGGLALEPLLIAASEILADELPSQLASLTHEREQLTARQAEFNQTIGSAQRALSQWEGRGDAAEAEAEVQACLAEISELTEQYTQARLAGSVLRRAMERYREKNQDPLVARASELFAELTCGAFAALRVDHAEGEPQLVGIRSASDRRAPDARVPVTGMSEGTADQLYLALRLASLERHFASHPPVPFVVDDILITFDNQRSAATLQVLARLARQTQVIFFTHHEHLVELAREKLPAEAFAVHTLANHPQATRELAAAETPTSEGEPFTLIAAPHKPKPTRRVAK